MKYTLFIANRYLRSKRRTGFISLITYLSAGGVALGAAALVIVLSVANGFENEVRERFIGADAPVRVTTFHDQGSAGYEDAMKIIEDLDKVEAVTPYILDKGMIQHNKHREGCVIRGIDPVTIGDVNSIPEMLVEGSIDSLHAKRENRLPGIISWQIPGRIRICISRRYDLHSQSYRLGDVCATAGWAI